MISKLTLFLLTIFLTTASVSDILAAEICDQVPGAIVVGEGPGPNPLARPESAHWDPKTGAWYVSNQANNTDTTLTDGYILKLNPDGSVAEEKWADGLTNPSGVRVSRGKLYVSNIKEVVAIDMETKDKEIYTIYPDPVPVTPNAPGINDPVVDKHTDSIYVSDRNPSTDSTTWKRNVWRVPLDHSPPTKLADNLSGSPSFGRRPNGVLLIQNDLVVVNTDGEMYRVDLQTVDDAVQSIDFLGSLNFAPDAINNLDGIERDGGSFLVTQMVGQPALEN